MEAAREEAVQLLNDAKLAVDVNQKVTALKRLAEVVIHRAPGLTEEFVPELVELQAEPGAAVRRYLAEFLETAAGRLPSLPVLLAAVRALTGLLADGTASVVKSAVQASHTVFRTAFACAAAQGGGQDVPPGVQELWGLAGELRARCCKLAAEHSNDSVRLNAAKFAEQVVLLFTAVAPPAMQGQAEAPQALPASHALCSPAQLAQIATSHLLELVSLIKQPAVASLSGPVAIVVIRAVTAVAQQRPRFFGRVMPPLLALALLKDENANASSVAASIRQAVKQALTTLLRCREAEAIPWRKKIADALTALGAGSVAETELRRLDRQDSRQKRATPEAESDSQPDAKRVKAEPAAQAAQPSAGAILQAAGTAPPASLPQQIQQQQQLLQAAPQQTAQVDDVTPPHELAQVVAVLGALAAQDQVTLAAFLQGLAPAVLVDVVIHNMAHLPPPPADLVGVDPATLLPGLIQNLRTGPPPPAAAPAVGQAAPATAALPPGRLPTPGPTSNSTAPAAPAQSHPQPAPAGAPAPAHGEPRRSPAGAASIPPAPAAGVLAPGAEQKRPPPRPEPKPKPPPPAPLRLAPIELSAEQRADMRRTALQRIIAASNASAQHFRAAILSRLFTQGGVLDDLLQHIYSTLPAEPALKLAVHWLHVLFAAHCQLPADSVPTQPAPVKGSPVQQGTGDSKAADQPDDGEQVADMVEGEEAAMTSAEAAKEGAAGLPARGRQAGVGASGRPPDSSVAGARYEAVLLALLEGVKERLPPGDRTLVRLLLDAPALPSPGFEHFLSELCRGGPDWAKLGLSAAWNIIQQRPPSRDQALVVILQAAVDADAELRSLAVRLAANKLFAHPLLADRLEQFARQQLQLLATARDQAAAPSATDAPPSSVVDGASCPPDAAASAPAAASAANGTGPASSAGAAPDTSLQPHVHEPPLSDVKDETGGEEPGCSEAEALRRSGLYMALCTKKHSLLQGLLEVYARAPEPARAAIQRNTPGLARTLGAGAPVLAQLLAAPPPAAQDLLLTILHTLTETQRPPAGLVRACLDAYEARRDARLLVPALAGLAHESGGRAAPNQDAGAPPKERVARYLPRLLELDARAFHLALHRLLAKLPTAAEAARGEAGSAVMESSEFLVALHTCDYAAAGLPLKLLMDKANLCMQARTTFPANALAITLQQLVDRQPLPPLFFRLAIQTFGVEPSLKKFVLNILATLIGKQVWAGDAQQWKGWIVAVERTAPDSFPLLLQLPTSVLADAAAALPARLAAQLAAYAARLGGTAAVPRASLAVLQERAKNV